MTTVRALIDSVNELAQVPLRAGSRLWRGRASVAAAPAAPADLRYAHGNLEPPLDELLGDPMVRLVMRADRLDPRQVWREFRPPRPAVVPHS